MKQLKYFILAGLGALILMSCDDTLNDPASTEITQRLEGTWKCDENSSIFKSAQDIYTVYITPDQTDSTKIYLSNFYQLGQDVEAYAKVSNYSITLPQQTLSGGYKVNGNATISSNLKQISWKYYVDDGSGQKDEVDALYTFQY